MIKQRRGLWVCICSLWPGAGELCMGFRKQGVSIMVAFWGLIALAIATEQAYLIMGLPIIWFYSFFNVHNLKNLSEEEFYSLEDNYLFHAEKLIDNPTGFTKQYRNVVAVILIAVGSLMLIKCMVSMACEYLPWVIARIISGVLNFIPQIAIALGIIYLGFYLIQGKKKELDAEGRKENAKDFQKHGEHTEFEFWKDEMEMQETMTEDKGYENEDTNKDTNKDTYKDINEDTNQDMNGNRKGNKDSHNESSTDEPKGINDKNEEQEGGDQNADA